MINLTGTADWRNSPTKIKMIVFPKFVHVLTFFFFFLMKTIINLRTQDDDCFHTVDKEIHLEGGGAVFSDKIKWTCLFLVSNTCSTMLKSALEDLNS